MLNIFQQNAKCKMQKGLQLSSPLKRTGLWLIAYCLSAVAMAKAGLLLQPEVA